RAAEPPRQEGVRADRLRPGPRPALAGRRHLVEGGAAGVPPEAGRRGGHGAGSLRELRQLQELALAESPDSDGALLLEGASLRLQADIRWLEACEQRFLEREAP